MKEDKIINMAGILLKFYPQLRNFFRGMVSLKKLPITFTQLVALQTVDSQSSTTMSNLADNLQMSNQQLTKIIDALADIALVQRNIDANNRRQVLVNITDKGTTILSQLKYEMTKKVTILLKHMPEEELDQLYDSLTILDKYLTKLGNRKLKD